MKDEDATFRKLRQRPFEEVTAHLKNRPMTIPDKRKYLTDAGWTIEEYHRVALEYFKIKVRDIFND